MQDSIPKLAEDYFDTLARWFPVMCASDEFHFLPRCQAAEKYYDRLDDLDSNAVSESIHVLSEFRRKFEILSNLENGLDQLIDLELLKASVDGVLIELENTQTWRHNPLLYLKIAFIGLDHALTKPADSAEQRMERARSRMSAIPRLLRQAEVNMVSVPKTYYHAALGMLSDCHLYLNELENQVPQKQIRQLESHIKQAHSALVEFAEFLAATTPVSDRSLALSDIEMTLRERFVSTRSLAEIYAIAVEEWSENMDQLTTLQAAIDPDKSWQDLYHEYFPPHIGELDTMTLYRREMENLQQFFSANGFKGTTSAGLPKICETPAYLRSLRSSASFSAAFSSDIRETDYFYITTHSLPQTSSQTKELLRKRLHREYQFLTAHEAFPGHYLLDSTRRKLSNPVRRQIESPLFYEGWAYYVESLLTEYGYVDKPINRLVDCKRRLWRAARCQIDIGLTTGTPSLGDAIDLLTTVGFTVEEAETQITRFRLNPGYQLCYSLGRYELMQLRKKYVPRMGLDRFHEEILAGGQLPFQLIDKRFEKLNAITQDAERKKH